MAAIAETRSEFEQSCAIVRRLRVARERNDEHQRIGTSKRSPHGSRPPDRARRRLLDYYGAELFAFPQRHDAVAGAGTLPDVEERIRAQLCTDRSDQPRHAGNFLAAATRSRAFLGSPAATLFA